MNVDQGPESFDEDKRKVEIDGAYANIIVSEMKKNIFIEHIEAQNTGRGAGSSLLNKLKSDYLEYIIEGIAAPYDRENPHQELTEQEIEKYIFLEAESEYLPVIGEEKRFIENVRNQQNAHRKFDPFLRLRSFYQANYFDIDAAGHFISRPPHRIRE